MNPDSASAPAFRKVAVLLSILDTDTADSLLDQMPASQASAVRHELMSLINVSADEQEAVMAEFFRDGGFTLTVTDTNAELEFPNASGSEYDVPPIRRASTGASSIGGHSTFKQGERGEPPVKREGSQTRFGILEHTSDQDIATFLELEHPQAAALVVSHLAPGRAAIVLSLLPKTKQTEIVRRLVELEPTNDEVTLLVELGVEERLAELAHERRRREVSLAAVARMLTSPQGTAARSVLENVAHDVPQLAQRLASPRPRPSYTDVLRLDALSLSKVVRAADAELLVLALAGSTPSESERILRLFPQHEAKLLRRATERLGPIRLSDVEHAQQELAEIAARMDGDGAIEMPSHQHFAAVA